MGIRGKRGKILEGALKALLEGRPLKGLGVLVMLASNCDYLTEIYLAIENNRFLVLAKARERLFWGPWAPGPLGSVRIRFFLKRPSKGILKAFKGFKGL